MPLAALLLLACGTAPTPAALFAAPAPGGEARLFERQPPSAPGEPPGPPTPMTPPAPPDADVPPGDAGLRVLFGIGLHGGEGGERFSGGLGENIGWGIFGGYLRLGAQVDDFWGVEVEGSGSWILFSAYARGALTLDYTPADWFTFAVGPAVWYDWGVQGQDIFCAPITSADAVGGTVRLDFHAGGRNAGGRNAFTLSLVMDLGGTVTATGFTGPGLAGGGYVALGYTHY
jgi:hypothetical protein